MPNLFLASDITGGRDIPQRVILKYTLRFLPLNAGMNKYRPLQRAQPCTPRPFRRTQFRDGLYVGRYICPYSSAKEPLSVTVRHVRGNIAGTFL